LTISCSTSTKERKVLNYKETKTSFFDLAHNDWTTNQWLRKPENLKMIHETIKKFGYLDLIPSDFLASKDFLIRDIYIKRNFYQLFDSLEITYNQDPIKSKYYREFWLRRKNENNDSIVFTIVREINSTKDSKLVYCPKFVNDTLYDLLRIQFRSDSLTNRKAKNDFETLKHYGFHQSAYNLLFERADYFGINWNIDSLKSTLDTTSTYRGAWFEDNTK